MSDFIDPSCDLKFPQNLIITESLVFDASVNVVNVDEPLLDVMEDHNMLTKKCLERENNLVLFNAKLDGKSSYQYARKIVSATYNYLFQVLDVLHLSVRWDADKFWFWSHASGLANNVISDSTAVYSNSSYKGFVVMIEPEPPPLILNIHVVSDCTAHTNVVKLLNNAWFRDYMVDYAKVRDALLQDVVFCYPDYDMQWWIKRSYCSDIRAGALKVQKRTKRTGMISEAIINKAYKEFNGSAKKWIPSKKEAFGIYFGTVSFEYFLEGSDSQLNG
jgi:hypothetical protein